MLVWLLCLSAYIIPFFQTNFSSINLQTPPLFPLLTYIDLFFIMAKFSVRPFLLLSKRSYKVTVENVRLQPAAAAAMVVTKAVGSSDTDSVSADEKKIFWMRDPKTGNWIPENHFGEVNVADLREKLLSKTVK